MAKPTVRMSATIFSVITFLLSIGAGILPCIAQSQTSQPESLGQAARDLQQQGQSQVQDQDKDQGQDQKQKTPLHPKVYHNKDVVSNPSAPDDKGGNASSSSHDVANANATTDKSSPIGPKPVQNQQKADEKKIEGLKPQNSRAVAQTLPARSVYDRPEDSAADVVVVPAGTEIHVNILDGNVALPVRLGFATPIPALSKVTVKLFGVRDYESYWEFSGLSDYASLTSVTIDNATYPVQTDTVPYYAGEEVFTLIAPLTIKR
jgi:hypothetical protein